MSGRIAVRALEARFERIVQAELSRLGKKMASLDAPQRVAVEAIATQVVRAIATRPAQALHDSDEPRLVQALVHLFNVSHEGDDLPPR